jgi:STE24 endopeptidase
MKAAILAGVFVFIALFVLTTFLPAPQARAEAAKYFSAPTIERGWERSLEGKLLFWSSTAVRLGALALVVFTGLARRLTDVFERWSGRRWLLTLLLLGCFMFLGDEILSLPLGLWVLEWQRAWGLTHRSVGDWLTDHAKGVALSAVMSAVVVTALYTLLRWLPRTWWALAAAGGTLLAMGYAIILPIWINPLFNTFTPLSQTQWASLQGPVEALAARAEVPVKEILVMDASRQGSHTNAYYTGFGATQRIVLYDTLLKSHPPLEVESILAHEMGHWKHQHILKGIALFGVGLFAGLFVVAHILKWAVGRPPFDLTNPADPAGLPLLLLLVVLGSWIAQPVESAISRHFERQADQVSLELANQPDAFIQAEKRLAIDNISNVAPNPVSVWLFASHPPPVERIHMAEQWQAAHR